jgi:hypothetical protein
MRHLMLILVLALLSACTVPAQDLGRLTLSAGPLFQRNITYGVTSVGGLVGFEGYFHKNAGVYLGFSRSYAKYKNLIDITGYGVLFGPVFRFPNRANITPFVGILGGMGGSSAGFLNTSVSVTTRSLTVAGGVDWELSPHVAVRVISIGFGQVWAEGSEHETGVSIGPALVFRF